MDLSAYGEQGEMGVYEVFLCIWVEGEAGSGVGCYYVFVDSVSELSREAQEGGGGLVKEGTGRVVSCRAVG
jgi:hypothetical protein